MQLKRVEAPSPITTDTPLDMSVRQRGLPPTYAQAISNPEYRSGFRPTVIHNGVPPVVNNRDELPSGKFYTVMSVLIKFL